MKTYDYIITNGEGLREQGSLQGETQEEVARALKEEQSVILSISEHVQGRRGFFRPHLGLQEKMMFTKNMAAMLHVGITIRESLETVQTQMPRKREKAMLEDILQRVSTGQTLGGSLREYEDVFSEIFVNMVATGEKSGNLENVLEYLGVQLEKEYELHKKVVSALIYPGVIISITLLLTIGIMVFIMPKISGIFDSFDAELPLITRLLIGSSDFLLKHPLQTVGGGLAGIIGSISLLRWKRLRPVWHRFFLHLPVCGRILRGVNLARFSRTMNSLLQAGVSITEALKITEGMLGNSLYEKALEETREKVEQGSKMAAGLGKFPKLFPPLATKMLQIGELTGSLELSTGHLAELYEREVDTLTKNLSVLLEPFLLLFMGVLIGGVAISIILPIYQLPNLIKH